MKVVMSSTEKKNHPKYISSVNIASTVLVKILVESYPKAKSKEGKKKG